MNRIFILDKVGEKIFFDSNYLKYFATIKYIVKEFQWINSENFYLSFSKIKMMVFLKVIEFLKHDTEFCEEKGFYTNDYFKKNKRLKMWKHEFFKIKKYILLKLMTTSSFLGMKKLISITTKTTKERLEKIWFLKEINIL